MSGSDEHGGQVELKRPGAGLILLGVVVAALLGLLVWWLSLPALLSEGSHDPPKVANRTDETLVIVQVRADGGRTEIATATPHSTVETSSRAAVI
jgi:hypothetical protein